MNHFEQKTKFEVEPVIQQEPFEDKAVEQFFKKWCEINDSIEPRVISRDYFEKRSEEKKEILVKESQQDKQILYIPRDLKLWEMIRIIEAVDYDTFSSNPERKNEAKEKIFELGKTFKNAGAYIYQRLDFIDKGTYIAAALAEEFYHYGQSLISGKEFQKGRSFENIDSHNLTAEETETIDHFLAGDSLYESRRARVEKAAKDSPEWKEDFFEEERRKTLAQFFRAAEKAFDLKNGYLNWQEQTPIHNAFIAKIEKAIAKKIEIPKNELTNSIFKRGMELLRKNMPFDTLPNSVKESVLHFWNGEKTLREALKITRLKKELEDFRGRSKDLKRISIKERQIANKIQLAVSNFKYKSLANNPSEIIANQQINCVGTSMLGGALMQEVGLSYLVGDVPGHSILFLITSDGNVEWRDMLNASFNEDLIDEEIVGKNKDGLPLKVADIAAFSKEPSKEGLMFDIKGGKYRKKLFWVKKGQRQYITVFEPEYGQKIQALGNIGATLSELGNKESNQAKRNEYYNQAIIAYNEAINFSPKYTYAYDGLGSALYALNRYEEAIKEFRKAIAIDPELASVYFNLGLTFFYYNNYKEAVNALQKYVDLADKNDENVKPWIKKAEDMIATAKLQLPKKK